ncbi:MAG TPA: Crp/Fnr family transcriptional regulator [Candidatus Baltobacteraceae bacterium]|jgi:CRP-like cAMP-binding protein|nr:Crp/Fnr family transcriptional regulator [Candidatus Baltobacteraceae bacterium]
MESSVLRNVPLFSEFEQSQLEALAARATVRAYPKGTIVVREGDRGDGLHVILSGSVAVLRIASDNRETILTILKDGDFFGEMSLFDDSERSTTVRAVSLAQIASIARSEIISLVESNPSIGRNLIMGLSHRLRDAYDLISATTSQDIRGRLATLLLKLMHGHGEPVEGGTKIALRLTNLELASMIGSTRESVNRTLNRFWDEHLIDMRTSHIIVVEPEKLRTLSP